jgi:type IV fimbrial biogenesis protein FimT
MCKSVFPRLARLRRSKSGGFTLIELMVTVAVLAILSAIAIPQLTRFITNARVSGTMNEYIAAVNLARAEAVSRGVRVTICAAATTTTCRTSGTDWTVGGWIVFVDDGLNPGQVDAGEEILRQRADWTGMASVIGPATLRRVSYISNGRLETGNMVGGVTFTPDLNDLTTQRRVCIDRSGRPRIDELTC